MLLATCFSPDLAEDVPMKQTVRLGAIGFLVLAMCGVVSAGELHDAVKKIDLEAVKTIIQANPSAVNETEIHGWTPLHLVPYHLRLYQGKAKTFASFLILHGADVNAADVDGDTPLHEAVGHGMPEVVELLLAHGAELEVANKPFGWTPLHRVAVDGFNPGHARSLELLLKHGADPNVRAKDGHTPLELAEKFRRTEMAKILRRGPNR